MPNLMPLVLSVATLMLAGAKEAPQHQAELVFPLHPKHNHAPGVVECPNGDLIVSWYRGSGERRADDVAVYGARQRSGESTWSDAFVMVDTPGFPDGNTTMMIDDAERLWVFWPIVLANTWESCITHYRVASNYASDGPPKWDWQGNILLSPVDFTGQVERAVARDTERNPAEGQLEAAYVKRVRETMENKLFQRLGWQPRCKPTVLPSGRILLPLYSDTFSFSIMAVSDDKGESWYASGMLLGFGNIQPVVLRRDDGTLVAYMRENGPRNHIRVCESTDDGLTWGAVTNSELPNPGAGVDGVRLDNGHWLLVYNDTTRGRNSLAVSISDDEGRTWRWTRHLEKEDSGAYHYPCVIQGRDGTIHAVYSYFVQDGKSMKHAAFNEAWVQAAAE